ncbi:uncharacterized protein LOC119459418 [Dermacentor silvarum]|uniref:uncharacterized protein LOC119459418 n=1 Tax=Dermacentor silvarum TaxID=543639 RepID=UPI00189ADFB0|nr:uncharacterized protein LOC119459418 [Dermacentor silvarum]
MAKTTTWQTQMPLLLILALALPCLCSAGSASPRRRREVFKRARPPGGDNDGGRPNTGLQLVTTGSDETGTRLNDTADRPKKRWPRLLDVGRLLQLVLSPSRNVSDRHRGGGNKSHQHEQPVMSRHIDASMAELVAVQTFDGSVVWIDAKFVNESHGANRRRRRRTRPYSIEERLALIIPVVAFVLPFLIWLSCMVICVVRASVTEAY